MLSHFLPFLFFINFPVSLSEKKGRRRRFRGVRSVQRFSPSANGLGGSRGCFGCGACLVSPRGGRSPNFFFLFFPFFFVSSSPPLSRLPLVPCFCLIRLELACSLPSTGAQKSHCAVAGTAESTDSMEIAKIETCCKHSS